MKPLLPAATRDRLWAMTTGFPGFHALNAGLAIFYQLVQTLVFARVLDHQTYSRAVAIQVASLYLLPINQSVARANFVLLRERMVKQGFDGGLPETAAAFQFSQVVMLLVPLAVPALIGVRDLEEYSSLAALLFFFTYSNIWFCEMQMTMMATGRPMRFEVLSLARRLVNFASLALLVVVRNFFLFNMILAIQAVVFHVGLINDGRYSRDLFGWPRGLTKSMFHAHLARLWISLQATFAEWLTLNGPYIVFTTRFGIGPGLVAVDAVMKLLRMVVSITRNLSEIALSRVSHALFSGEPRRGRLPAALVVAGGGAGAGMIAAAVAFWPRLSFNLLLGPNNTVPVQAGLPAAIALLAGVTFAAGSHLVGHTGQARAVRLVMWIATAGICAFALYVLGMSASVVGALWAFAFMFGIVSLAALVMLVRLVS